MTEFAPALPPEGQLVKIPLKSGTDTYISGTLSAKTAVQSTAKTLVSTGITYAELRSVGLEVELTAYSALGALVGFEVTDFQTGGKISALYDNQVTLCEMEGFASAAKAGSITHYGRSVIIGLRDKAELEKTNTLTANINVFARSNTGTIAVRYLLRASAILDVIDDPNAEASD